MPFKVEILENEPVLLATLIGKFDDDIDFPAFHTTVADLLNSQPGQVYYILDLSKFTPELTTLMTATNAAARGSTPNFRHRNVYEVIFVTTAPLMEMAARGMNNEIFGNVHIAIFPTLDQALAYTRG